MSGRNRTMIIMAAVLAVLAGAGWWLTANPATPPTPTPEPTVVVWDQSSATVLGVTVQSMTQTTTLQNVSGNWKITAPLQADADATQVGEQTGQLTAPVARSKIGDNVADSALAQYGLDSPALTITVVLSGTTPQEQLLVGKANVDGSAYYVRPAGSHTVSLVANTLIEPLRSWLTTPPVALPTETPLVPTILPTDTATNTLTLTGTETVAVPAAPAGAPTNTSVPAPPTTALPTTAPPTAAPPTPAP